MNCSSLLSWLGVFKVWNIKKYTVHVIALINKFIIAHSELLEVSGSVFLSCWMVNMQHTKTTSPSSSVWGALEDDTLIQFASNFLSHNVKLLSIFIHIIEERDPEIRDKVQYTITMCIYLTICNLVENTDRSFT